MTAIAVLSGETGSIAGRVQQTSCSIDSEGNISDNVAKLTLSYLNGESQGVNVTFSVNRDGSDFDSVLPQAGSKNYRVTVEEVV